VTRDRWVPVIVFVAAVVTVALVAQLANVAWRQAALLGRPAAGTEIGAVLGAVGAVALLAGVWMARYHDVSPWARAAVALVGVHIAIAAGAWWLSSRLLTPEHDVPLLRVLPAPAIALGGGVLLFVVAAVHRRARRLTAAPGWLRGAVVFALSYLLALGIWVPIVVPESSREFWSDGVITDFRFAVTLVPPAAVALATALVTIVRPSLLRTVGFPAVAVAALFLIGAMGRRDDATMSALAAYANYVPVLFAAAWFAMSALAALAWTHARVLRAHRADAARPAPWVQSGVVESPPEENQVGTWHVDGWLAGFRTSLRGFTLRTARGDVLRVPDGARLVAPVPSAMVGADAGEHLPALRAGEQVTVSGFVAAGGDGPYRSAALPVPGSDGLVVSARRRADDSIGRDVILVLYRPCVLFLIFVALAALPGIVGNDGPR
jgi:hypothetical protein